MRARGGGGGWLRGGGGQVEQIEGRGKQLLVTALRYDVAALERELRRLAADKGLDARIANDWTQVQGRMGGGGPWRNGAPPAGRGEATS